MFVVFLNMFDYSLEIGKCVVLFNIFMSRILMKIILVFRWKFCGDND